MLCTSAGHTFTHFAFVSCCCYGGIPPGRWVRWLDAHGLVACVGSVGLRGLPFPAARCTPCPFIRGFPLPFFTARAQFTGFILFPHAHGRLLLQFPTPHLPARDGSTPPICAFARRQTPVTRYLRLCCAQAPLSSRAAPPPLRAAGFYGFLAPSCCNHHPPSLNSSLGRHSALPPGDMQAFCPCLTLVAGSPAFVNLLDISLLPDWTTTAMFYWHGLHHYFPVLLYVGH